MRVVLIIIFFSGISHAQFDIQTQWDNDFMGANRLPDTVCEYDGRTYEPVPLYEIRTYLVGMNYGKIEVGDGYYIIFTNKYRSVFIDKFKYNR